MWWPKQEFDSLWEYTLAHRALRQVFSNRKKLRVADYGYRTGHLSPMLVWLGHDVTMIEVGRKPPEEENFMLEHLLRVTKARNETAGSVTIWPKTLDAQVEEDKKFDAVFSLSTLEPDRWPLGHFIECLKLVKDGGLLFVTTSDEKFDKDSYEVMIEFALAAKFKLVDGVASYDWEHRKNGFTSLALRRQDG